MDSPPQLRLSPAVRDKLAAVRGLLRKYVVWQTGLMIACWCLFLFWFGGLIDYMPVTFGSDESSPTFRGAVLLAMGIGSLVILLVWCAPRLFARLRNSSLALLIEQHHPELDNHLVTAVELDRTRDSKENTELSELIETDLAVSDPQAHQAMLQRVHAELDQRIQSVVPSRLFNWQPVVAAATCVLLSTLITLLGLLVMPSWMSQWSQRLFALSDTPWPRLAELRADGIQIRLPTFSKQLAAERKTLPFVDGKVTLARGATALLQVSAQAESKARTRGVHLVLLGAGRRNAWTRQLAPYRQPTRWLATVHFGRAAPGRP